MPDIGYFREALNMFVALRAVTYAARKVRIKKDEGRRMNPQKLRVEC
jgi:hypothetical protein